MKNQAGFGFIELLIVAVLIVVLTSLVMKQTQKDDASVRNTLAAHGLLVPRVAVDSSSNSVAPQPIMREATTAVQNKVNAIADQHMKQLECQTNPGQKCEPNP